MRRGFGKGAGALGRAGVGSSQLFSSHRKTVVCPIIDVISDDTFEYMAGSDMTYGGFNWKLNFRWYPVPQREMDRRKGDRTLPVR